MRLIQNKYLYFLLLFHNNLKYSFFIFLDNNFPYQYFFYIFSLNFSLIYFDHTILHQSRSAHQNLLSFWSLLYIRLFMFSSSDNPSVSISDSSLPLSNIGHKWYFLLHPLKTPILCIYADTIHKNVYLILEDLTHILSKIYKIPVMRSVWSTINSSLSECFWNRE